MSEVEQVVKETEQDFPWLKGYPAYANWHETFEGRALYSLIDDAAHQYGDNVCTEFLGSYKTYGEVHKEVNQFAKSLQEMGVKKGDKIGLFLPNCPHFIISFFAILKIGATVVNFSPLYSIPELKEQVEDSETDIMITMDLSALYPNIKTVLEQSRLKKLIIASFAKSLSFPKSILAPLLKKSMFSKVRYGADHLSFEALIGNDGHYKNVDIDPHEDVAVIQYTGGTTGVPKGAMLTHANVSINIEQIYKWTDGLEIGNETMPGFLPFFHVFALCGVLLFGTRLAARIIILPKFDLQQAVTLMKKYKPTLFPAVPTMFSALLNHPDSSALGMDQFKMCMSGGAPLPVDVVRAYKERFNVNLAEGYGLTESSPVLCTNPFDRESKAGSIGLPIPGTEMIIVDREDPHKILPYGEVGEICARGPQIMKGYWKRPDATADTIINGMLRTGDVGYIDAEGYTYIIDRMKDLILAGGFNVFPRNVEEAIYEHESVEEVIVIGIPDDYLGEKPKAFIKLQEGHELSGEILIAFLKDRLGKHELPKEIEFRDELPKTMIGKLSKKELVAEEKEKYEKNKQLS